MILIFKLLKYHNIQKRYMETATMQKPKPKNKSVKTIDDEIQVDENANS